MEVVYQPELVAYMEEKGRRHIAIEVISADHSDFDVTELYVHFMTDKRAAYFKESKHFRSIVTKVGEVLLPPYRLEYDDVLTFGLGRGLFGIKKLTYEGGRL